MTRKHFAFADFTAYARDPDGYATSAGCAAGHISVHATDPDGHVWVEQFTSAESRIHDAETLRLYCQAILWQWRRRREANKPGPWGA